MFIAEVIMGCFCVYLMVDKHIERSRSTKREQNLLNRIMARDYYQYATAEAMQEEARHSGNAEQYEGVSVL